MLAAWAAIKENVLKLARLGEPDKELEEREYTTRSPGAFSAKFASLCSISRALGDAACARFSMPKEDLAEVARN
jgi:hypothetical protein